MSLLNTFSTYEMKFGKLQFLRPFPFYIRTYKGWLECWWFDGHNRNIDLSTLTLCSSPKYG